MRWSMAVTVAKVPSMRRAVVSLLVVVLTGLVSGCAHEEPLPPHDVIPPEAQALPESGRFVLAMELVEGHTFEKMIFEDGRVPWPLTARIGVEVCKALDYAHSRGVVHRDIKPSNVLVRDDGSATVMDLIQSFFGWTITVRAS